MVDAQVAAEDQSFWNNPCVDLRSIVRAFLQNFQAGETVSGASTICQQLVRMRLFSADLLADPEPPGRAQDQGGDPGAASRRPLHRRRGQAAHPRDVHEPVLLREPGVRDLGCRQRLLRQGPHLGRPGGPAHRSARPRCWPAWCGRRHGSIPRPRPSRTEVDGATVYVVPPTAQAIVVRDFVLAQMLDVGLHHPGAVRRGGGRGDRPRPAREQRITWRRTSSTPCAARRTSCSRERTCSTPAASGSTRRSTTGLPASSRRSGRGIGYDMDRMTDEELIEKYGEQALSGSSSSRAATSTTTRIVTVNYRTGAVLAYVGSANFYGEATPEHQPNFDVIGQAYRQSGSAFKPITYATGFEDGVISPATMFMDVRTNIADGFNPPNADNRERGPVRVRDALKYSLNIPVTKAQQLIGTERRRGDGPEPRPPVRPGPQRRVRRAVAHARDARHPPDRPGRRVRRDRERGPADGAVPDRADRGLQTGTSSTTTRPMPATATRSSPPPRPTSSPTSWPTTPTPPPTRCGARASSSRPMTAAGDRQR